jgi:hypothetical protein
MPLAESWMVHGTISVDASSGDRLVPVVLTTDDGVRAVIGAHDAMRSEDCAPLGRAAGDHRCVPTARAETNGTFFADGACTVRAAYGSAPGCTPTVVFATDGAGACGWQPPLFAAGAGATTIFTMGATCTPFDPGGSDPYWTTGAALATDALADMVPVETGTGRLRALYLGARAGGEALLRRDPAIDFHDTMLDVDCAAAQAADGMARCIPTLALTAELATYADAACAGPRVAIAMPPACAGDPIPAHATDLRSDGTHVFTLGTTTTTIYTRDAGGVCTAGTPTAGATYYVLDTEIDPAMLARVMDGMN